MRHPRPPSSPAAGATSPFRLSFVASAVHGGSPAAQPALLPALLRTTTRSGDDKVDPLLAGVVVEQSFTLASARRDGAGGERTTLDGAETQLLALESEDGSTLLIRSDALAEAVAQLQPEAIVDGAVDLMRFTGAGPRTRGYDQIGEVVWRKLSVLRLPDDGLAAEASELARRWAKEQLGEAATDAAYSLASALGAKALMWTIEARLAGRPGLYRWREPLLAAGDLCAPCIAGQAVDARLAAAAQGQPMLVLIHGTGSYTVGAFADLRNDARSWEALKRAYPGGIFGFEHRSFSESPLENALALLQALPEGAKVALLTHSRGGLVGDLLCLGAVDDAAIDAYRIDHQGAADAATASALERESQAERQRLRAIRDQLRAKRIACTRYVRVAAPARGTRLLSDNLDAALSDLLNVMQWGGGALLAASASALGGPVAGIALERGASSCLGVVNRLVLEIAARRIDARLVPGIAAMRTDSPLAAFLANPATGRSPTLAMAVIAGDTEFNGSVAQTLGAPFRRIANLFCDWRLFDSNDNDLIVDTDSMYAGLGFRPGASYLFDQDASVSHFRYFRNAATRDALCAWLVDAEPAQLPQFSALADGDKTPWSERDAVQARRGAEVTGSSARPVAIIVPGIMGTHLMVRGKGKNAQAGKRIWFASAPLALGEIERIADVHAGNVAADDLFELIYGELAEHLAATHAVLRCPYDWRQSPATAADALRQKIDEAAREHPGQTINLVVHSLGGLVARSLIARHAEAWRRVVDSGGRLLMLGTPNNGAHIIVHTLLGKASAVRLLEKLDLMHDLQAIVDIVGGFPGVLALLPRPGFADSGVDHDGCIASTDYYRATTWQALKQNNSDRWYGDAVGALPGEELLAASAAWWKTIGERNEIADPGRVIYLYGQGERTPCGVARGADGRPQLLYTNEGDGWVSWASGRLDNVDSDTQGWLMPVEHGDLPCSPQYFPAIVDLLECGRTDRLGRLPRRRGEAAPTFVLDSAPPVLASEDELTRALAGSSARRRRTTRGRSTLRVAVRGGDLRAIDAPVLCGHYVGDAISGAEAVLDGRLDGALAERERIGVYAGELGTSAIVLRAPSHDNAVARGAVIVGLGKYDGQLGARQLTETVRAGVVRFLLQLRDAFAVSPGTPVELCSLLIGWNSAASLSVAESVAAICRGVIEANHQFGAALARGDGATQTMPATAATVTQLTFVELYRNAAITAAHAVAELPATLASEQKRLAVRIDPAPTLASGTGLIDPLDVEGDVGHWSRLLVSDADEGKAQSADAATDASVRRYPERLKFVLLSPRARAETIVDQHQPGVIEAIVSDQRNNHAYDPRLGQILFQLTVPVDFKAAAREQARLLLVLDGYSARLPWELLQADELPLVITMPMVRQLSTQSYRPALRVASSNSACLIAAPSTAGFDRRFAGARQELDALPQAERETQAIGEALRRAGWNESDIVVSPPERAAVDVLATLYARPYRVLAIAAHGVFEAPASDGRRYTGVVLSDGLLLTAIEIGRMEVVPELVFVNCCHLGQVNDAPPEPRGKSVDYDRLAYSLARQLIEMGVRCIVAAAWAVDDSAACTFATTLFDRLAAGAGFGDAVFNARRATFEQHPASNTWGAYQAYGDPGYRLHANAPGGAQRSAADYVALDELLAAIAARRAEYTEDTECTEASGEGAAAASFARQRQWVERQLARCPPHWAEDPRLLQDVAALYADCGEAGFGAARDAYLRALATDDPDGRVTLTAIEDLAALEIAHVEALVGRLADATPAQREVAQQLIGDTLARLDALGTARADGSGGNGRPARSAALRQRALACRNSLVPGERNNAAIHT